MKVRAWFAVLALSLPALSLLIGLSGCQKGGHELVAKVGRVKITKDDFANEISNSPPAYQNYLSTIEGKKQFLDILLKEKILLNEAERSGIARRKEIQAGLKEYKEKAREQEAEFRKSLVLREYLRELQDGELKVTEGEIQEYYDKNREDFLNPVRVTASHILSSSREDAEAALQRLKKKEDFAKLAQEVSKDPSAGRGGLIGEVMRGDLTDLPEFEKALFFLKSGEISDIVQTKIGFHIIKKNGEIKLKGQSFEQAAAQIRRFLEKQKFDRWIDELKKKRNITIDEKVLADVPVAPPASVDASDLRVGSVQ